MRTFDEIKADIDAATSINDTEQMSGLADELLALGSPEAEAVALRAQGIVYWLSGNYPSALERYERSRQVNESLGDRAGAALAILSIGIVYADSGDYPSALANYQRALEIHEELGNRAGVAHVIGNMGNVYFSTGNYPSALEHYRRTIQVYEELGDRAGAAAVTGNMGNVYFSTANYPSALEHYQRALQAHDKLGDRYGIAIDTGNIGNVYNNTSDYESALEHFRRAIQVYEEVGDRAGIAIATGGIITAKLNIGAYTEVAALIERQAEMLIDAPDVRAEHHANRARLAEVGSDLDTACTQLELALAIALEAGLRAQVAEYHEKLRDLAQKRNDFPAYIQHNNEYQRITEEINGKQTTQRLAMMEAEKRIEGERKEREKERALLYGTLPKSVADRMIRGEQVTGDQFDAAAVLFTDVVGFTSHTSLMHPGDVVVLLATMFSAFDKLCEEHSVIKIKTIGDSYMCFKGDADAATNASSMAALALALKGACGTWPDGTPIQIRIGIHIGPATAGVIGTDRLQYDVWGDTVNVASRLEGTSLPGRIHVSDAFVNTVSVGVGLDRPNHDQPNHDQPNPDRPNPDRPNHDGPNHDQPNDDQPNTKPMPPIPSFTERGLTDLKGKGVMNTWWMGQ